MRVWPVKVLTILLVVVLAAGCGPKLQLPGTSSVPADISASHFITDDGILLPLRRWAPSHKPRTVVIALHGFNDHSVFINDLAEALTQQSIFVYAYDQRGFGAAPHAGIWAGTEAMQRDLRTFTGIIRDRYPSTPIYLLGESMGGALILLTLSQSPELPIEGAILSAPAVWGGSTWPWYQRGALWFGAHILPWLRVSGEGLDIIASDNNVMLRELGKDPLVIKHSRLDSLWGLSLLMGEALQAAPRFRSRALILIGERDEIIPLEATGEMVAALPVEHSDDQKVALYNDGYHMLTRDLQAAQVWKDIVSWINSPDSSLPSGADIEARKRLLGLSGCDY